LKLPQPDYKGRLLGIKNNVIYGWAYDANSPNGKLILEVLLDGYLANLTIANLQCKEYLSDLFGDNCYGFISQIPPDLLKISHRISIRIANSNILLEGAVLIGKQNLSSKALKQQKNNYNNLVDSLLINAGGLKIGGHYFDPGSPDISPVLHFYDNNNFLFSKTLQNKKNHVYKVEVDLPVELADGNKHSIKIIDDKKRELKGSPLIINVFPDGAKSLIDSIIKAQSSGNVSIVESQSKLLGNLVEQYNKYLPVSFSFENYPYWYNLYSEKYVKLVENYRNFLIVIYGDGDINVSINSLKKQYGKSWQAVVLNSAIVENPSKNIISCKDSNFDIYSYMNKNDIAYLGLLKAGDHLSSNALCRVAKELRKDEVKVVYTDIDFDNKLGERSNPWFKPDWDYELFLSQNYLNEFFAVKSKNIPKNYKDSIDLLPLYCIKKLLEDDTANTSSVRHISEVLYHKQHDKKSKNVSVLFRQSRKVIQNILDHQEYGSLVEEHNSEPSLRRIKRKLNSQPLVSIIIPTKDQVKLLKCCIKTLLNKTSYKNYEILIIDNQSLEKKTLKYFDKLDKTSNIRVLEYPRQFNYSAINNYAVNEAKGEVVALVNNDIEFKSGHWLDEMLGLLLRNNVGAVGCKLAWPNGMVQHGGVVLGVNGLADHAFNTIAMDEPGYHYRAMITQQYSAVTAACLLTRKEDYLSVEGLNEIDFPVAFNDVDYCLKLRKQGKRIVWTPFVDIIHAESASRGTDNSPEKAARAQKEMNNLKLKWGYELMHDPFYNPNLNLDHLTGPFNGLAIPPRNQ